MFISNISDLVKEIEKLSASDRKTLLDKLSAAQINDVKAAADKQRLSRLDAAATDPKMSVAFATSVKTLARLGLDLEKVAAAGDTAALDRAMQEHRLSGAEKIQIKTVLANIGAIR
jgi:hypothetical protein